MRLGDVNEPAVRKRNDEDLNYKMDHCIIQFVEAQMNDSSVTKNR